MKRNLFILTNTTKSLFGIGDYIRIISVINNLNLKKIYWLSNEILLPFARDTKFFLKWIILKFKNYNVKNSFVINCYGCGINGDGKYFLRNLFKKKKINDKKSTEKFVTKLMNFFSIKNYQVFSSKKNIYMKK